MSAVVKEGWLLKRGEYISTWRPRYFVLRADGKFRGYRAKPTSDEDAPANLFDVKDCSVSLDDDKTTKGKFGFVIRFVQLTRVVERSFHTETSEERLEWVEAIEQVKKDVESSLPSIEEPMRAMSFVGGRPKAVDMSMESFEMLKVLGKGSFGKVMLAKLISDGHIYAIKILKKSMVLEKNELTHTLTENAVLAKCTHPFLTSLHYSFQTPDLLCFVMEYVNGGELFFHLRKSRCFSEERTRIYIGEILLALTYLHDEGIIYRDLKLENLLLDANGHIKITDFGLCKEEITYGAKTSTFCGTPEYLAPEVITDSDYGRAVDWWGLGVVMYEMLSGTLPFESRDYETLFNLILKQEIQYPAIIQPVAKDLLSKLLIREPSQRLGGSERDGREIQEHEWFVPINFDKLLKKEIVPPFIPEVKGDLDVSNFDEYFTREEPKLSPTEATPLDPSENEAFKGFDVVKN